MTIWFNSYITEWSWLSNFSPHPVGEWPTLEHAYQASRTLSPVERELVRRAHTPGAARNVGKTLTDRPNWSAIKVPVMKRALMVKFSAPELRQKLLDTGSEYLIHLSPWDSFWGADHRGNGENVLGKLIMEVRNELKTELDTRMKERV